MFFKTVLISQQMCSKYVAASFLHLSPNRFCYGCHYISPQRSFEGQHTQIPEVKSYLADKDYLLYLGRFENIYLYSIVTYECELSPATTTTQGCPFIPNWFPIENYSHSQPVNACKCYSLSFKTVDWPCSIRSSSQTLAFSHLHTVTLHGGGRANFLTWEAKPCDIIVWHIINTWWLWMQPPMLGWRVHSSRNWNVLSFKQGGVTIKIMCSHPPSRKCLPIRVQLMSTVRKTTRARTCGSLRAAPLLGSEPNHVVLHSSTFTHMLAMVFF